MSRIDGLSSVFPLRLARAYAPESVSAATPAPARRGGGVPVAIDRVDFAANAPSVSATRRSAAIEGLIAARVSVPVSFNEGDRLAASAVSTARSTGASLPFYVHPTDKNSAATAINVGRILDITA